jgi:hypothetical protein
LAHKNKLYIRWNKVSLMQLKHALVKQHIRQYS